MKLSYFLFIVSLFLSQAVVAQKDSSAGKLNGWSFASTFRYGHIYKHTPKIIPDVSHLTFSGEMDIEKQTTGKHLWQQFYHYPVFGAGLLYTYYGNPKVLGNSISAFPYMSIYLLKRKIFDWKLTIADGICYMTRPYNVISNPDNNVIGTTLNDITRFSTSLLFKPDGHFSFSFGGSFTHFSNGAVALPNLGINIPSLDLTARYTFGVLPYIHTPRREWPSVNHRLQLQGLLGIGWEQHAPADGPNQRVFLVSLSAGRYISHVNRFSIGMEGGYSTDIYNYIKLEEITPINHYRAMRSDIFIKDEFVFDRFGLLMQVGYYVYYPVLETANYNTKLGVHYYFLTYNKKHSNHLFAGVYLSAHQIDAEYVETAVGIDF